MSRSLPEGWHHPQAAVRHYRLITLLLMSIKNGGITLEFGSADLERL